MIFTKTMVDGFIHKHQQMFLVKELRLGQMFYDHFKLHQTQDRELADQIYESDGERFWKLIWDNTDWNQ